MRILERNGVIVVKKKLFSMFLALLMLTCLLIPASADFDPATRDSVAVVYTCLDLDGGEYGFGWGSGFFVGKLGEDPSFLITNYHVIADFVDYGQGELVTISVDGERMTGRSKIRVYYDSKDYEEAYVVGYDAIKDVAVLKLANPTSKRKAIPIEAPTDAMVGSKVYAVGYPGLAENVFASATTSWGKSDSTVTSGTISRLFLTAGTGVSSIQIDCDIKSGNSGGPLVNDNGAAVGVNTYSVGDEDNNSLNYAINISEAITLLNQYSVPFEGPSAAPVSADAGSSTEDSAAEPAPTPEPAPERSFPVVPVAIGAAVLVIAAAVVAVVLASNKNKKQTPAQAMPAPQPQPQPQYQAPAQAAPAKKGYIRSLSPQHRGNRVEVSAQPILLGRSQECGVVYQSGTPGVSGRHASLTFDKNTGEFILTDLQSSYGTYLQNGQKLTPNMAYRLRSGDQFYLGENGNMLQVTVE